MTNSTNLRSTWTTYCRRIGIHHGGTEKASTVEVESRKAARQGKITQRLSLDILESNHHPINNRQSTGSLAASFASGWLRATVSPW